MFQARRDLQVLNQNSRIFKDVLPSHACKHRLDVPLPCSATFPKTAALTSLKTRSYPSSPFHSHCSLEGLLTLQTSEAQSVPAGGAAVISHVLHWLSVAHRRTLPAAADAQSEHKWMRQCHADLEPCNRSSHSTWMHCTKQYRLWVSFTHRTSLAARILEGSVQLICAASASATALAQSASCRACAVQVDGFEPLHHLFHGGPLCRVLHHALGANGPHGLRHAGGEH